MTDIVWLHEDALRANQPALAEAAEGSPAVFIWDEAYLRAMDYGFKRLVFIYETLCDLPVAICRGNTVETLRALAAIHQAARIIAPATPNPALQKLIHSAGVELGSTGVELVTVEDRAFVSLAREPDLKRFFRYWNVAREQAMRPTADVSAADKGIPRPDRLRSTSKAEEQGQGQ